MKKILLMILCIGVLSTSFAQKDSTPDTKRDTMRIGGLLIITKKDKRNKPREIDIRESNDSTPNRNGRGWRNSTTIERTKKKKTNVSTNWFAWDIGFNNYKDETNYTSPDVTSMLRSTASTSAPGAADFKVNTGKSINVNIWLFNQKLNLIKNVLGFKYSFGIEYYNFRYKSRLSFKDATPSFIIKDSVSFSKNKLTVKYLTVPVMLTINPTGKGGFSLSAGLSAGYRFGAFNKQKSEERGKDKERGDFGLNPWKLAIVGDIGYNKYRIFGSYSLTPLHEKGLNLTPYSVGLRFSNW
jgi:hypothetical protein